MNCPKCETPMSGGVCPECGFPVTQIKMVEIDSIVIVRKPDV